MDQSLLVGILESPGKLNRNIDYALQRLLLAAFIDLLCANQVSKAACFYKLREDARDTSEAANIIAADDVRMQTQVDPSLCFSLEVLNLLLRVEEFLSWRRGCQIHVPVAVMDSLGEPHSTTCEDLLTF